MWNALSDQLSGGVTDHQKHGNLLPEPIDPVRNGSHHRQKENVWSNVRRKIHRHVQNTSSPQYTSGGEEEEKKIQKKTIQTIYASCYTERHSVWFVRDYCRRSVTHNCYKVERKGQLCPQLATISCTLVTFRVLEKACANVLGKKNKTLSTLSKMGNNWSSFSNKTQTRPPCIRQRTLWTREVNIQYLKTWQTIASVSVFFLFLQSDKEKNTILLFAVWISAFLHKPEKRP